MEARSCWWCPFVLLGSDIYMDLWASQVAPVVKNPPVNAGDTRDLRTIPGSGRSHGGGHGNPLPYSCLESPRTEEPGRLQSQGHRESDRIEVTEQTHVHSCHSLQPLCPRKGTILFFWKNQAYSHSHISGLAVPSVLKATFPIPSSGYPSV